MSKPKTHPGATPLTDAMAIDPVCGMTVDPHTAKQQVEHAGHTYYFCGPSCSNKFMAEPLAWLEGHAAPPVAAPGTIYTCPMHSEVQQVGPGTCPKCAR